MTTTNDGGSAFPRALPKGEWPPDDAARIVEQHSGMSLRDYFAGQALAGILAAYTGQDTPLPSTKFAAITAYDFADAMIAERAK